MSGRSADDWIGFWALTPVCGPYLKALCIAALKTVPALGFACCRVVGTRCVHSNGLDPVRIIKPEGLHDFRPPRPLATGRPVSALGFTSIIKAAVAS